MFLGNNEELETKWRNAYKLLALMSVVFNEFPFSKIRLTFSIANRNVEYHQQYAPTLTQIINVQFL